MSRRPTPTGWRRRVRARSPVVYSGHKLTWTTDKEAGKAFEAAAAIHRDKLSEPDDAANIMIDAFKVYRKEYPDDAIRCIKVAIDRYQAKGNFRRAASHMENAAELLEVEMGDRKGAMKLYSDAARWYEEDGAKA